MRMRTRAGRKVEEAREAGGGGVGLHAADHS